MNSLPNSEPVAVVGLGLLGRGIAASFLGHGFRVIAVEPDEAQRTRAHDHIASMIAEMIDLGGAALGLQSEWLTRYIPTPGFELLTDCTFVVESVTEDPAIKHRAFESIEAVVGANVVIASNTSSIPISQLQQGLKYPARLVGMHWAEPAHATRFMELVRGAQTSTEALESAAAIARRLEKEPCICQQDIPAFIVNRIGYAMYREALHLLETGVADVETIDLAVRNGLGLWASICGPFRWIDLSGGPEVYARALQRVLPTLSKADDIPASMRELAESGARGTANGRGFFQYTPEEARRWDELYRRHAWRVAHLQNEYFRRTADPPSMSERESKLEALGYPLERTTPEGSLVESLAIAGSILYASGQVPFDGDKLTSKGKVPSQVSVEEATQAAALCAANVLRAVRKKLGSLDRVERVVRITGYMNADPDFADCHLVINGASKLVHEVFGEAGRHARTALAMAQLPLGSSVEVEMILQIKS